MGYNPLNPNGQALMAASQPVAIASDQSAIPVSGPLTDTQIRATALPVSGPLTDTQIRATALPISGTVTVTGVATETTLAAISTKTPALGPAAAAASSPVTLSNENIQDLFVTGQSAQTATVNNILTAASGASATDLTGYRSFAIQVISTGTAGTFIFEGSNDNTNFQSIPVYNQALIVAVPIVTAITATASNIIYVGAANFRYIRLRIATLITGGSIQAFSKFAQISFGATSQPVSNGTAANLLATVSGSLTTLTTLTTCATLTTLANGQTAHSSASTGSPVRIGGRVITTLDTTLAQSDASDVAVTTGQQLMIKPFATSENDWQASSGVTPLATTTSTALKAAGAASIRNFVTAIQLYNNSATVSTAVSILDGSTVIWTGFVPATTAALPIVPVEVVLPTPLRGTAATAMNIQCGTAGASVYYNVQGYQSF